MYNDHLNPPPLLFPGMIWCTYSSPIQAAGNEIYSCLHVNHVAHTQGRADYGSLEAVPHMHSLIAHKPI